MQAQLLIPPLEEQLEDIFVMSVLALMKHLFPCSVFCLFSWMQNLEEVKNCAAGRAGEGLQKTKKCSIQTMRSGSQGPNESIKAGEGQAMMHWGKPQKIIPNFGA